MKKIILFLMLGALLFPSIARAQFLSVNYDKKVIYTDSLNLPSNSSARSVLLLLPELLQRPEATSAVLSTYDIQVNDMSVGQSADALLLQLNLFDIEKVEISESPTSSYKNNGQGGSINFILRDKSQVSDSRHPELFGGLGMTAEYPLDFSPNLHLGYKKGKFTLQTLAVGEWYSNDEARNICDIAMQPDGSYRITEKNQDIDTHFYSQMVRVYTKYTPTDRDFFKFNLSESSTSNHDETTQKSLPNYYLNDKTSSTTVQALFNYKHVFRPHCEIETEIQYIYNPGHETYLDTLCDYANHTRSHNVSGKIEFKTPLVREIVFPDPNNRHFADIKFGLRANGVFTSEDISNLDFHAGTGKTVYDNPLDNTFFLMPYAELEAGLGKFRFKAIGEYQHYEYHIHKDSYSYGHNMDDFTGKLMLEWHFTANHQVRLVFDSQIIRPTDDQIFPYVRYNPTYMAYVKGTDLPSSTVREVKVDYIGFIPLPHRQNLMLNAAVSYNNVSDIVRYYRTQGTSGHGSLGETLHYYTFINDGQNKLVNANIMAHYTYRMFSFAFTGNLTHLYTSNAVATDEFTLFNLSFYPSFKFPLGWSASLSARYFSRVHTAALRKGDYGLLGLIVGKDFGPVNINVFGNIALDGKVHDITYTADGSTVTSYVSETTCVGLGVHWNF